MSDRDDGRFDDRNWPTWPDDDSSLPLHGGAGDGAAGLNGHGALHQSARGDAAEDSGADDEDAVPPGGGWVSAGGVMRWEGPEEREVAQDEIASPLAADQLDLPIGAPDEPRVRAVHAWILRQRANTNEALGSLLLAQRAQRTTEEDAEPPRRRAQWQRAASEASPLALAIATHEAAVEEFETLLEALDTQTAHSGPGRALVEYYLWLGEHLAALASAPEAGNADTPPATLAAASWLGRAQAALAVRGRVEQVTSPEPQE